MECHTSSAAVSFSFVCVLALLSFDLAPCNGARVGPDHEDPTRRTTEFIRSSCGATEYPALCFTSLSAYASTIRTSPMQLADVALAVCLSGARNASSAMAKASARRPGMAPGVAAAMADCVESMGDAVSQLRESVAAMGRVGPAAGSAKELAYQINSIQTWVSAALTDDDTCMDGFAGAAMEGEVKDMVKRHVVKVAQLTSNALALVNGFASSVSPP
ncbi:hypothetical protein Cni_G18831 [Canna indica]|uniref:Pectinesterase inhibitor domain-containing protein n=1 Tax=Canna indica TaxID=4628 RepID=A0AAQ3KJX2_9LILI|nr:hypothetical protein Cni_G18831 [Canna indica]